MTIVQSAGRAQPAAPTHTRMNAAVAPGWPRSAPQISSVGPRVAVTAVPGGWMVSCDLCAGPLVFRSGGRAEAQARRLARWAAGRWGQAELILQDARGALVAAISIGAEPAASRRAA